MCIITLVHQLCCTVYKVYDVPGQHRPPLLDEKALREHGGMFSNELEETGVLPGHEWDHVPVY